ncbi:hypothetical protein CDL15_Pgr006890 [Punica granatum]|nr:hypothetical protein CDL15_Pgr006890 [Punica granatum]
MLTWVTKAQCILFPSVYELERQAIDALKAEFSFPIYSIGPAIPCLKRGRANAGMDYMQWLDKQPGDSVLYVSHGSFLSASGEEMDELAAGLRESQVRFLWVAREESPRVKESSGELGMVVPWCDQLKVLSHTSVGGFWTHCGWNSIKEGISSGVPFLTFPFVMDQIPNSKLVVEDCKIGWRVRDKTRQSIADLVCRFMDPQNVESKEMRRRAKQLQEICQISGREGGSSETNTNAFIDHIFKISQQGCRIGL